ncbi:MAG TPA: hypothetical protein VH083_08785, partial [Myxococcales bacterium]|nr:hypothetical protein [Myxococcales bacterium]
MPDANDKLIPPVLAAMSALDQAVAEHELLVERLAGAMQEGVRLDEELRAVDFNDHVKMGVATKALAFQVSVVQRIAWKEETARRGRDGAQQALVQARKAQSLARSELLRIELEIDAASIWDMVGQFEAKVRGRLEEHAKIASEMNFAAAAAGEQSSAALEAASLTPALGTSGPDLWSALAGGVRQLYDHNGAPLPGSIPPPSRADFEKPALTAKALPAVIVASDLAQPIVEAAPKRKPAAREIVVAAKAARERDVASAGEHDAINLEAQAEFARLAELAMTVEPVPAVKPDAARAALFAEKPELARPAVFADRLAPLGDEQLPFAQRVEPAPVVLARAPIVSTLATPPRPTQPVAARPAGGRPTPIPLAPIPPRPPPAARPGPPVPLPGPAQRTRLPPPPPPDDDEPRFDFARPPEVPQAKTAPPAFHTRGAPLGRVVSSAPPEVVPDSVPPPDENKRGRLDRMLRNLAGMVGPRRAP